MVTADAALLAFIILARVLLASSMFIQDVDAVSMLGLPLLLAGLFAGRASDDDFIVVRFLVSRSATTGISEDFIVIQILASGPGATGDSLISCYGELAIGLSPLSLINLPLLFSYFANASFITSLRRP